VTANGEGAESPAGGLERERLERRAAAAESATITWNLFEMVLAVGLGVAARSLALVAFGFDSMIEVFASLVVVWHLRHPDRDGARITARAIHLVGLAFLALAVVLTLAAIWALATRHVPDESPAGIAYLALTILVMLGLASIKRRLGRRLGSAPLAAEARMSMLDAMLAASVLLGLIVNAVWGWWWADAVAAFAIAAAAVAEGVENRRQARELSDPAH
jgi:divalent metal cation (Fe/Co/Zn/Cd) transporter